LVRPLTPSIGAEVVGLAARDVAEAGLPGELRRAFVTHKVLVLRDQQLDTEALAAFAAAWGPLAEQVLPEQTVPDHPEVQILEHDADRPPEYLWHTDLSWHPTPPLGAVLAARVLPPAGGDTLFADMGAAYAGLSDRMQRYLHGLAAVHDRTPQLLARGLPTALIDDFRRRFPPVEHPVVRTHPESGERVVFVNASFTTSISGVPRRESEHLLAFLFSLTAVPEYQLRVRWEPGTVVLWDNRAVQHYAISDYWPERRVMERVVIAGDRPI
jgi:taurine dioxygenase